MLESYSLYLLSANIFSLYAVCLLYNFIEYGFKVWMVSSHTDGGTEFMIYDKYLFLFGFLSLVSSTNHQKLAAKRKLFSVFKQKKIYRRTHPWQDDTRLLSWFSHVSVCSDEHSGLFYSASLLVLCWILLFGFLGLLFCTIFSWRTVALNQMMS